MASGLFDNHAHMGPKDALDVAAARQQTGFPKNPPDAIYRADSNLETMDRLGIERRVLSPPPLLYGYELEASAQPEHCRRLNDWIVEATEDDRLLPMGLLPLGAPDAVGEELDRCIDLCTISLLAHMSMVHISTTWFLTPSGNVLPKLAPSSWCIRGTSGILNGSTPTA